MPSQTVKLGHHVIRTLGSPLLLACVALAWSQEPGALHMNVTYVTTQNVYFNAGEEEGLSVGDTVAISRAATEIGRVVVTHLAPHSSVARRVNPAVTFLAGDIGVALKKGIAATKPLPSMADTTSQPILPPEGAVPTVLAAEPAQNTLHGRIALQYFGEVAEDSRLNVQQPGLVAGLVVGNLAGTGMSLSLNARGYTDLTNGYYQFGTTKKTRLDLYDFRITMDHPDDHFGFSAGRMSSRFVSSLGIFDGAQVFGREAGIVAGVVAGRAAGQSALNIPGHQTRTAVFVGYDGADEGATSFDGTVAYARQTLNGSLDRQFLTFQGSTFLGNNIQAFGNADLELNGIENGKRTSARSLSNASLFVNYTYAWWLSASLSYDESRSVYLFETMKSTPDSLFDEALQHGFRFSITTRPAKDLAITGAAGYRYRPGDPRPSHTLSGSVRAYDVLESGFNATIRYTNAISPFLTGNDGTIELDHYLFHALDLTLRYDHYAFGVDVLHQVYLTQTFSADMEYRFSRSFYGTLRGDYILDNTMNSTRFQVEVGWWL